MHELIQSEIQSDIISEKSLLLPAEVFRFRSVPFREIYPTVSCRSISLLTIDFTIHVIDYLERRYTLT